MESLSQLRDDVADLVDEQAYGTVVGGHDDAHGLPIRWSPPETETVPQVQGGDDLAAQIREAGHPPMG